MGWRDPRIWLVSLIVVLFGIAGALLNFEIANKYVTVEVSSMFKACFSALVPLVAALVQFPLKFVAVRFGKGSALAIGAVAVFPVLWFSLDVQHLEYGLSIFYILFGIARG